MDILILQFLAGLRSDIATFFASVFSFLGEERLLIPLAALFYWCVNKKEGERLLFTLFSSAGLNAWLKKSISRTRPFAVGDAEKVEIDNFFTSTAGLKKHASFPSGHAQLSTALYGGIILRSKGIVRKFFFFIFILFICMARIYLGVHYPTDVLAGVFLGLGTVWFWTWVYEKRYEERYFLALLFCIFSLLGVLQIHGRHYLFSAGALAGITAGGFSEEKLLKTQAPRSVWKKLLRCIAGFAGMGNIYFAFSYLTGRLSEWLCGFAAALWISFVLPVFFKIFKF